jgi:hypothetical protein
MVSPAAVTSVASRYHFANGWWGDQGATSQCTAYSLLHFMEDGPVTHHGPNPLEAPAAVYAAIQAIDRAEGRDYGVDGGATMLAQCKAALGRKWFGEYRWGYTLDELITAVLTAGPVLVGTNWYTGMFDPDDSDRVRVSGSLAGGHAYLINGVNRTTGLFRLKNSWGRTWARRGHAYLSFDDMARLILEDGEVVLARELP